MPEEIHKAPPTYSLLVSGRRFVSFLRRFVSCGGISYKWGSSFFWKKEKLTLP
jgi:hypothetical protein